MYFKKEDKFEFNKWEQLQYIGTKKYSIKVMAKFLVYKSMGVTLALKRYSPLDQELDLIPYCVCL